MKHTLKITFILLGMFFVTQLIGLGVIHAYAPEISQVQTETGETVNVSTYNLPYGTNPPSEISPEFSLFSIIISISVAILLIVILMKINAETFLRIWFFTVVTIALGITINSALLGVKYSSIIALIVALPLAFLKIFRRNVIVHNATELLIYPGIAAIFVPLLNIWAVVVLLIIISIYDIYAVWHSGFMQKMAKYQMRVLRIFSGFYVPYIGNKERKMIAKLSPKQLKKTKIKVNLAILGGGDVVFPMILAGVVLNTFGLLSAIIISLGATFALAALFYNSEKGKFYPAMPFITAGCLIALLLVYLIPYLL